MHRAGALINLYEAVQARLAVVLIHTQTTTISWRRTLALPSAGLQHWGCARETLVCMLMMMMMFITITARD